MYVIFRNNCPVHGRLYDDFRICDINTENVVYTIIPSSGHDSIKGKAQVWGCENDYNEPLVNGTWKDVQKFFGVEITTMKKKSSKKPKVQLIGKDSNIFNLLGIASKALRENQMQEQADDMISRVKQSQSFDEALSIITEYVEAY
ncbi:MAG: hypothetical protein LBH59_01025 [Planctomycetaceae bacterium]|nr:hypothetical protein [Planctomycetaceae bacterium]